MLLGAPGIATTRGSWPYYQEQEATSSKGHRYYRAWLMLAITSLLSLQGVAVVTLPFACHGTCTCCSGAARTCAFVSFDKKAKL